MSLILAALALGAGQTATKCVSVEPALIDISSCSGKAGEVITLNHRPDSTISVDMVEFFVFTGGKMVKHSVRAGGTGKQQTVQIPAALCELPSQRWTMRMTTGDERPFRQTASFETRCPK